MKKLLVCPKVLLVLVSLFTAPVFADCAGGLNISDARQALDDGARLEAAGQYWLAINAYNKAQRYVCSQNGNPVAAEAINRAAAIAANKGGNASSQGLFFKEDQTSPGAFQWFEKGLLFAAADKALVAALKTTSRDIALSEFAQRHFAERGQDYFNVNNKVAIATLGAYKVNQQLVAFVNQLPIQNMQALLHSYNEVLPDNYLQELADLERQRYTGTGNDIAASIKLQERFGRFQQRWDSDRLEQAIVLFEQADSWLGQISESAQREVLTQEVQQARMAHAERLLRQYADVPALLGNVIDLYQQNSMSAELEAAYKLADKQADKAMQVDNYLLASRLYELASNDIKAAQAQQQLELQQQQMGEKMYASYARQAADVQKQFSDPEVIKAMQQQALQLQQQLLKQSQFKQAKQQKQQQLEAELGL